MGNKKSLKFKKKIPIYPTPRTVFVLNVRIGKCSSYVVVSTQDCWCKPEQLMHTDLLS